MYHPAHGLLSATDFLNNQLAKHVNVQVTLGYRSIKRFIDTGEPCHEYAFRRNDDGRQISLSPYAFQWVNNQKGPAIIDWSSVPLHFTAQRHTGGGLRRQVQLSVSGFEMVSGLHKVITELSVSLFDHSESDQGFFAYKSPVLLEFRRRLTIENAHQRKLESEATIDKHLSVGPFVAD